jgi:Methyltransferase domain
VSADELHVPVKFRRNYAIKDEEATIDGAEWLIGHVCEHLGLPDLGSTEMLDFGCGVRFTQAFLNRRLPIKRYVGVDIYRELIEFLQANVSDPRFEFVHVNAHNALYNPTGEVMSEVTPLPIDGQEFDLICLFSVFTHLAPHDYVTMLRLLRRFAKPTARLFYTLFLDEPSDSGRGLMDTAFGRSLVGPEHQAPLPFRDLSPNRPLLFALYSREHALELIEGSGWEVVSVSPPSLKLQHHIVCAPIT